MGPVSWYNKSKILDLENLELFRKITIPFFLIAALALVLAGCAGLTPPASATLSGPTSTVDLAAAAQPTATEQLASTIPQNAEPTVVLTPAKPECRVDASTHTDLTLADRYPKVGATEWSRGPEDAFVTIIEYSDFQ